MRRRSYELVIHITSIGEFSFLFYFTIFPSYSSLQGNLEFCTVHIDFFLFLFLLISTFLVVLFLLVSCLLCVHNSLCSGTETLQADWKGLVLHLNKGVKSVCAATRWCPHMKSSRANMGFKGNPMPTGQ